MRRERSPGPGLLHSSPLTFMRNLFNGHKSAPLRVVLIQAPAITQAISVCGFRPRAPWLTATAPVADGQISATLPDNRASACRLQRYVCLSPRVLLSGQDDPKNYSCV